MTETTTTTTTSEEELLAAWLVSNAVSGESFLAAISAAEEWVRLDNLAKSIESEKAAARDVLVVAFDSCNVDRLHGVIVTKSERRTFDHDAAARIAAPNLVEPKTSAALVDAALLAGTIDRRQYDRITTAAAVVIVQQERKRKP